MLDVCRHFFKVDEIKKMLDLMALQKLNTFHWHLTEDQGWRIEIKNYSLLTDVGAYRDDGNGGIFSQSFTITVTRQLSMFPEISVMYHVKLVVPIG